MSIKLFKEDFFERIINVKWTDEKRVNWICGDIQSSTFSQEGTYWTSTDGKNWSMGTRGPQGYASGLWMRQGFDPKAGGLWLTGGDSSSPDGLKRPATLWTSTSGTDIGSPQYFDHRHFVGKFTVSGSVGDGRITREDITFEHADIWTSTDGVSWTGGPYHPEDNLRAATGSTEPYTSPPSSLITPAKKTIAPFEFDIPDGFDMAARAPLVDADAPLTREEVARHVTSKMGLAASPTPREGISLDEKIEKYKLWDIFQLSNRNSAIGTLREGKAAGKVVKIKGGAPVGFHGPGSLSYTYFKPNCTMSDAKTGKKLSSSNCGVPSGHSMCYGYYVFVVVGNAKEGAAVSHTEDGVNWHTQILHANTPNHQANEMWSLVVGPQPSEDKK